MAVQILPTAGKTLNETLTGKQRLVLKMLMGPASRLMR